MKNLRLLLIIPVILFFASILVVFFSPVKLLPCEVSVTDPATSWEKTQCKGYYLIANASPEEKINVNNSAFLINLVILVCGSFLVNGILFLILFIVTSILGRNKHKTNLDKWEQVAALDDEVEEVAEQPSPEPLTHKTGLFSKLLTNKNFEDKFNSQQESNETNK